MSIPTPASPSAKTPGFYLNVNLLAGVTSPGAGALRILLVGMMNLTGGDLTPDTEIRQIFSAEEAKAAGGPGGQHHLAALRAYEEHPTADIYLAAAAAPAGVAASVLLELTGTALENSVIRVPIKGEIFDVAWNIGEDDSTFRTRLIAAVNGATDDIPMSAASTANPGETLLTTKQVGTWGNDIIVGEPSFVVGGSGIVIETNIVTVGTLNPDFDTILDTAKGTEFTVIAGLMSNADSATTGATSNGSKVRDHITLHNNGLGAKLQTGVVGFTGAIADAKAGAIDRNNEWMWTPYGKNWQSLPCELAGAEAGQAMKWVFERANYNRIGNTYRGLLGPVDETADFLQETQTQDLLLNGVSPLNLEEGTKTPFMVRPITMHSQEAGNPDDRAFDMSDTFGALVVARDLRTVIPQEFKNASITEDLADGSDSLPAGVVERKDVQAFVESRLEEVWVPRGVVNGNELRKAIEDGTLIVEINASDDTQVDIYIPLVIVKPLAKLATTVAKVG